MTVKGKFVQRSTNLILLLSFLSFHVSSQSLQEIESSRVALPNGWKLTPVGKILPLGDLPLNMAISPSKKYLAVTNNGQSDQMIQILYVVSMKVIDSVMMAKSWVGLAFSDDEKFLYASGGHDNWIVRFAMDKGRLKSVDTLVLGRPWPEKISVAGTCIRVAGNKLFIANGKGLSSFANPYGPNPTDVDENVEYQHAGKVDKIKVQYIGGLFRGSMSILVEPDQKQLAIYSQAVYHNTPYSKDKEFLAEGMKGNPIPMRVGDASPIKFIFYVIKENRTYDQVLGDIPEGNGDPGLVLFGEHITPNQHTLAREFVLLDNFYVDGEVSADGHNWSMGAYATDYIEKNWPARYGGRGGGYDSEGSREIANNKDGYLWDFCRKYGVTYRTYGEFVNNNKPSIPVLEGHYCTQYTGWDERVRDTTRFYQWKHDFDSLVALKVIPQLNTIRFINDHTEGLNMGRPTPFAHVADNDLAVGLFVDYLSHSTIWNECAIFIVEDDAQNGPDHVDAHRTTAYVAGGFVREGFVDHTMYSTSSMLRTIELILGLPPMSQYDASATPMWRCFNHAPGHKTFSARACLVDLNEKNTVVSQWSKLSESFNFDIEDRVPDAAFNEVIWRAVKGLDSPCPAPVHAAFFMTEGGARMNNEK
jgi:hypothetical protein